MQPAVSHPSPALGSVQACAETGKPFTIACDGCSYNYATNRQGEIISDEGVNIRERRELLDRSRPFACYVSDGEGRVTGWKGNTLGHVVKRSRIRNPFGGYLLAISVRDVHGGYWYGRGAGGDMCILLRPSKHEPR